MRNRGPWGMLAVTLAVACFDEGKPVTTSADPSDGTSAAGTVSSSSGLSPSATTAPTDDDTTSAATPGGTDHGSESVDGDTSGSSTGEPLPIECGDGQPAPGELCLGETSVLTANAPTFSARIGDVSGSASPDVVYIASNQLVVRVGDGDGEFGSSVFGAPMSGRHIELDDFDGDGQLDVIALEDDGPLRLLLGNGGGGFAPSDQTPVGAVPQSMAVGDLDGNGAPDAVVGNREADAMLFPVLGDGDGGLTPQAPVPSFGAVPGIALADFTGDGALDVALTVSGGALQGVALRPGDGLGGLLDQQLATMVADGAGALTTGDFDGDGAPDLAYVHEGADALGILRGDGRGGFAPEETIAVGPGPHRLIAGDITRDGRDDLVIALDGEASLRIMVPDADGAMEEVESLLLAASATALDLGDVNGDGVPDIAATSTSAQIVTVFVSTP